ncbi:Restriction-modification methylase [Desulfonema limicola]|uniref:site-specific DNA-methyltransferase (adenine-specific) n=1 Tax=Desulfonema limicola TaxID=45656 RepID=A0A975GH58_9BACT|nr:BREX-1 system adenine-specific DNA-methyltransferase PglX [Desulfonema limicola]QTA80939.1 Restriction-modification methylase [Desulfonema limicola]
MKLADHVDSIRDLIHKSFSNYFARLGISAKKQAEIDKIPENQRPKRAKLDQVIENHIKETGSFAAAYEKALDEYTFTLFNRVAAVKVMESHMMFPEVITKRSEQGNRSFAHKAWLEQNPDMAKEELEGIREFIKFEFNRLGEKIPLFHQDYHYALLPYVIELNEIIEAFNAVEKDPDIDVNIWQSDDILGWLYESYNNAKKTAHKAGKQKTEYHKVFLQSQVYTPRWVVKFLVDNSLGKLYLEMFPDSEIKDKYKIANAPETRVREIKSIDEIRIIDPAAGSGNFLFYAFDLFFDLYMDQIDNYDADFDEDDVPKLILEKNLFGIDIDDRAVQIAQLGLFIKAMRKKRDVHIERFNVISSDFFLPEYSEVKDIFEQEWVEQETKELIRESWEDLRQAYKFGSLVRTEKIGEKADSEIAKIDKVLEIAKNSSGFEKQKEKWETWKTGVISQLYKAVEGYGKETGESFLGIKTKDAITFLSILNAKYDVAVANPPYTDSSDFGPELKQFIERNYKKPYGFHTNLYASFIKRCDELIHDKGKFAMIHPHTFMFIKTFEGVREYMIDKTHIDLMVDFGLDRVNLFGPGILLDATFYVLSKGVFDSPGVYFNLTTNLQEKFKKDKFHEAHDDFINGKENERVYVLEQSKLKIIKSWPFIYWISDGFREKFKEKTLDIILDVTQGAATSNNNKYLRYWFEIEKTNIADAKSKNLKKWLFYSKGGPFKKWYGNLWLTVNWENDGFELRNDERAVLRNSDYYFKKGSTYSASGSKGGSFRELPENCIFDTGGSCVFPTKTYINNDYIIAFLNSKLVSYIVSCLNPTVNMQVGDLKRIPFIIPNSVLDKAISFCSDYNINIQKHLCQYSIIEFTYKLSPLIFIDEKQSDLKRRIKVYYDYENHLITQILLNEAIINEKVFEIYELTPEDKAMVIAKEGECVGGLPVLADAKQAYLDEDTAAEEFPLDNIRDFIKNLPEKEFTPEEKKAVTDGFPSLYQKNNDLEEFCNRNRINPINIWYWFKQSSIIPKQRMNTIAMEFLADIIREILMEDNDGIVPLVRNSGEEILINRIEKKFMEKGFTSAQFSQFDKVLGRELNEYLNKHFFKALSDHLNLFMYLPKTPFIWHITSGPAQGFDAYIIIYKWNRDRLFSIKSIYMEKRESALKNRLSDLQDDKSPKAQEEKDLISKQIMEISSLKTKMDELLAQGYNPVLDDGVGKNIAPLQEKGIISYDVLNKGQLEKYLNADW